MPLKTTFRTLGLPFDGVTNRFIVFFSQHEDIEAAAKSTHITIEQAQFLYQKPGVKEEIDKRRDMFHLEVAKLNAEAAFCIEATADAALVRNMGPKVPPHVQVRAAEILYKKMGLLKEKVEHSGENGGPIAWTLRRIEGEAE